MVDASAKKRVYTLLLSISLEHQSGMRTEGGVELRENSSKLAGETKDH